MEYIGFATPTWRASPPAKPNWEDFFKAERSECSLSHVLLQALDVTYLTPIPDRLRIWLLEILGDGPSFPSSGPLVNSQEIRAGDEVALGRMESVDDG